MLEDKLDAMEAKRFWSKIWEQKEHNKNTEWKNNVEKEFHGHKESTEMEIY